MNAPAVSLEVAQRFHALRRRYLAVRIGISLSIALMSVLAIWLALAAADYYWEWTTTTRKIGLLVGLTAVITWTAHRLFVVLRDTRQRHFAGTLESSFDDFGQRIRTVLETVDGRVQGPTEMLAALGNQTLGRWETCNPTRLVPGRQLMVAAAASLVALLFMLGLFAAGGDWRTAMLRAMGTDLPYTELAVTPGNARVLEGAPVEVSLELSGRTNRDVLLRYRYLNQSTQTESEDGPQATTSGELPPDDAWTESELLPVEPKEGEEPDPRLAKFSAGFGKAKDAIEYQFITSIGQTQLYRIDVQPLIEAERTEIVVTPPAYTRLETRSFVMTEVSVLEQSRVSVTIQTNHPLAKVTLETGAKPSKLKEVEIQKSDERTLWTFDLPSADSLHWRFTGAGDDGTPMTPVKGRLRVRRDGAPNITWRDPPDQLRVHTLAEIPMRVQIADDYGITEAGIVFQLGGDDEYVLTDWVARTDDEEAPNTTRLKLEEILPLESFSLSERDYISYYAYAVDNREPGQRRSESDVRYIDIRPLRQFYSEIELDPNNGGGGRLIVQLDEIIRRQRFLINRTRKLLRSSSVDLANQLGTIDRMVESQSELAGLTRFLAEFFISRGNDDVEALSQAEAAMLQAADSLAAGSFDLALVQEEDALRALAEARRTLEIFLVKNLSPQQRQALRRLARQLRQKLRRERPESEQQIADTLKKIASEQMQLGESAARTARQQQSQSTGSSGSGKPNAETEMQPKGSGGSAGDPSQQESAEDETDEAESVESQDGDSTDEPKKAEDKKDEGDQNQPSDGDEPGNDEPGNDEASNDEPAADEPSLEEQQQDLYSRQVDLLERIQAIDEELADRLASSPLMERRMEEAKSAMDDLATAAREGQLGEFATGSRDVGDQLREIGVQLDALAAVEPVSRVSAIRDMTSSLANMEADTAEDLRQTQSRTGGTPTDATSEDEMQSLRALRLKRRTETIEDVLKAPVETGDVETSEVNDSLEKFIEANEFLEQLEATRAATQQTPSEVPDENATAADEAMERAVEYADAARQLDDLYRQLVTPRLARLRDIEQRANQLAQQMNQAGNKGEQSKEAKNAAEKLNKELQEQGLGELAELLETDETMRRGSSDGDRYDPSSNLAGRTMLLVRELRARIHEMILMEISADRDAPIPPEYRDAVDKYFRVLAGEAEAVGAEESVNSDAGAR